MYKNAPGYAITVTAMIVVLLGAGAWLFIVSSPKVSAQKPVATATKIVTPSPAPTSTATYIPSFIQLQASCNGNCIYLTQDYLAVAYGDGSYHPLCGGPITSIEGDWIITCPGEKKLPILYSGQPIGFCQDNNNPCHVIQREPLVLESWTTLSR